MAVIGLGYVGLPLAISFAEAGLTVEGVDAYRAAGSTSSTPGHSPIDDVSDDRLTTAARGRPPRRRPRPTPTSPPPTRSSCASRPRSPTTKDPDLAPGAVSGRRRSAAGLRAGPADRPPVDDVPGHDDRARSARCSSAAGLTAGADFDLAFAPERVNPGDPASASKGVPRLVGGDHAGGDEAGRRAPAPHQRPVIELSSPDAAELAKLLENVFRNVNIAFVNQLALLCERMGLDVWEVIDAAATKPFGFMRFTPGPGVGGHCIPVDPYYLAWRAREFDFIDRFIELAGDINFAMPRHVVDLVAEALNDRGRALKGAKVGILGVAFKPNVRDAAQLAGGRRHRRARAERGADVRVPRPARRRRSATRTGSRASRRTSTACSAGPTSIVVVTAHRAIDWASRLRARRPRRRHGRQLARARRRGERQVLRLGAGWSTRRVTTRVRA